jgi:hypothetical protein
MRPQEKGGVLLALGQGKELLGQLLCRLILCPLRIKGIQSHQHREELRDFLHLPAQL